MNSAPPPPEPKSPREYFVDEAGDDTLFNSRGKVIIGEEGCSRFFLLGVLALPDADAVTCELAELRVRLLADPYFKKVPSMQPAARKTAVAFHAKDDVQEVRRDVFAVLARHPARFCAVVREKAKVLEYVRQRNERDPQYRYRPNELYDSLVRRLFKNLLHQADAYHIYFARRGKSDRTGALKLALQQARQRFAVQNRLLVTAPIEVKPARPATCPALQVVDYYLWAVQRVFERGEDRYAEFLAPSIRLVHDVDDTRWRQYGEYYDKRRPLNKAALRERPGI